MASYTFEIRLRGEAEWHESALRFVNYDEALSRAKSGKPIWWEEWRVIKSDDVPKHRLEGDRVVYITQ